MKITHYRANNPPIVTYTNNNNDGKNNNEDKYESMVKSEENKDKVDENEKSIYDQTNNINDASNKINNFNNKNNNNNEFPTNKVILLFYYVFDQQLNQKLSPSGSPVCSSNQQFVLTFMNENFIFLPWLLTIY